MHSSYWCPAGVISLVSCLSAAVGAAGPQHTSKVQGTVIAITFAQSAPLIGVVTPLGPKNHMTVGAAVTGQTKIIRGNRRVSLNTIKEGDIVWLTYVKA